MNNNDDDGGSQSSSSDAEATTSSDHDEAFWRNAPGLDATPLLVSERYQRIGDPTDGLTLTLEDLTVYRDGVLLRLKCSADDSRNLLLSHFSLAYRSKPPAFHHASVRLTLPNGVVLDNESCNPRNAPKDPTSFWMACGNSFRSKAQAGAEYFVSPLPKSGTLSLTVRYEAFGLNGEASIKFDLQRTA